MPTSARASAPRVAAVRAFNRFYTRRIGLLQGEILESPYSLTQVRVLYELAHTPNLSATDLGDLLGLDPGYLSRILRGFEHHGLITRTRTSTDKRRSVLGLPRSSARE